MTVVSEQLKELLYQAISELKEQGFIHYDLASIHIQINKSDNLQHGDYSTNLALVLAKHSQKEDGTQMTAIELATQITNTLPLSSAITDVDVAPPGFINFKVARQSKHGIILQILEQRQSFAKISPANDSQKIHLEFVSANPTGPLHIGHGRHAAYGMSVANLLRAIGHKVHCEYYVNDAGRQMDIVTTSVWLRYLQQFSQLGQAFPQSGYHGSYIKDIASQLQQKYNNRFVCDMATIYHKVSADGQEGDSPEHYKKAKETHIDQLIDKCRVLLGDDYQLIHQLSLNAILTDIQQDLSQFRVNFDYFISERELIKNDVVKQMLDLLAKKKLTYEKEGAIWFKSTEFGDTKDRVLRRSNGQLTYFSSDIIYHRHKLEQGYDQLINILGSDHHGYVARLQAIIQVFSNNPNKDTLTTTLLQFVALHRNGEKIAMSTRTGKFVTLTTLVNEVGIDAARFYYVTKKESQPIDFDIDLATSKSQNNILYYIQYAHARICSVLSQAKANKTDLLQVTSIATLKQYLQNQDELALIDTIADYPKTVQLAAHRLAPHLIANYLKVLAQTFHGYYDKKRFLTDNLLQTRARISLILAIKQVLINGLQLLNIHAPEKM